MGTFKTSLFGFNKKDVSKFIASLSAEYSEKVKKRDEIIKELEEKIERLENGKDEEK